MLESEINNNNNVDVKKIVVEDDDDDVPTLSADTMAALLEFYAENKVDEENKQENQGEVEIKKDEFQIKEGLDLDMDQ